jgi:hypothetical protein
MPLGDERSGKTPNEIEMFPRAATETKAVSGTSWCEPFLGGRRRLRVETGEGGTGRTVLYVAGGLGEQGTTEIHAMAYVCKRCQ